MKKLYALLKIALGADMGVFVGSSLYQVWEYYAYPQWYAMQSAPWYTGIQINAALAAGFAVAVLIALYLTERKLGRPASLLRTLSLSCLAIALCVCLWMGFEIFGYHTDCGMVRLEAILLGVCLVISLVCAVLGLCRKTIKR